MPGNIAQAAPATVFPAGCASAFTMKLDYALNLSTYQDGAYQSLPLVDSPRHTWVQTRRLTPSQLATLVAFYVAHGGNRDPFWFYDPFATASDGTGRFTYDASGASSVGRYPCRFDGALSYTLQLGRASGQFTIIEIA